MTDNAPWYQRGNRRALALRLLREIADTVLDVTEEEVRAESEIPWNRNGGLTLVPMPGMEDVAARVKKLIEEKDELATPVDIALPEFGQRSSGEPFLRLGKRHVGGHDCIVLTSGPGTHEMLGRLMFLLGQLSARKAARITVVSGYFPLGRSDKDEGDEFALPPMVMNMMMGVTHDRLSRVVCVDPHAEQVVMAGRPGQVTPVRLVRRLLDHVVREALKMGDPICLAFPDDSAAKRFETAIRRIEGDHHMHLPKVTGIKRRSSSHKSTLKHLVGDLKALNGATVILLDDEIATGGSVIAAAQRFEQEFNATRVWAAVTHGVLCGPACERFSAHDSPVDRLIITDTIPVTNRPELKPLIDSGLLQVWSWEDDLAWVLYRIHWNLDIREMR